MQPDEDGPNSALRDRRHVTPDEEAFDALQRRVDAPGERRAGAAELFERRRALSELVAISEELGLYDQESSGTDGPTSSI